MKTLIIILMWMVPAIALSEGRVRRIAVDEDQIVPVHTAVGIATIIQVPDRPNSVVMGDQDSFKVEYLDKAVTVKPLHAQAKSNLYLYTDLKRFNVQLITGSQSAADYVVYLDRKKEMAKSGVPSIRWTLFRNKLSNGALSLETKRVGTTKDGVILVEFLIRASTRDRVAPEWIWLTQSGSVKPIHHLFLSNLSTEPGNPIQGILQILKTDLNEDLPLRLELRRKRVAYLIISKAALWK